MKSFSFSRIIFIILLFFIIFLLSPFHINMSNNNAFTNQEFNKAVIKEVLKSDSSDIEKVKVIVEDGVYKGKKFIVDNTLSLNNNLLPLKKNDRVLLLIQESNVENLNITIYQYIRQKKLLFLVFFFILLVLIVGGIKGVNSLLSVAFTIYVVSTLLLPGLISGYNPITFTIICNLIIAFFSLIIQNGISKKL